MPIKATLTVEITDDSGDGTLRVPAGTQVTILEQSDDLYTVQTADGKIFPVEAALVALLE